MLLIPKHNISSKTYVRDTWIQFALFVLKGKSNTALALKNDNITLFESVSPNWYCCSGSICFPSKRKLPVMYGLNNYLKTKAFLLPSLFICGEELSRAVYFNKIAFRLLMAGRLLAWESDGSLTPVPNIGT